MREGIQAIIRQIDTDAAQHSDERYLRLKAQTDREIERENALFLEELEQRRDVLLTTNKLELQHRLERYSRRLNRELLSYRRELLDEIFSDTAHKLAAISDEEYMEIFAAAIKDLVGNYVVSIGERSREKLNATVIKKVLVSMNKTRIGITVKPGFIPKKSGFVLTDGHIEYNYLFEDLIEDIKNEQSALILKEVFGEC